ncbi:MAG: RNA-guided pseudouridylation complex pseudouridine synthase subunit Cbf5 [Candidatus Altiarchaeales archaeon]|nr:MAG: RNA-guided pseudouridylation complex pseudouridine synthase subunit Cbf5 [Candidatus Altiarchaeales archaeon]RLI94375.1 MAG: RNA-guided pseudouridylation complex pseudouridine synthase subunit Cbf5 [Candidatus Altiarchaeales archaeon]
MENNIIVKSDDEPDPRYGCYPEKRPIHEHIRKGIINLDKPSGPTSHQVVSWIKEILGIKKAGHSGTLDPKTTGVLPVALEEATKILRVFFPFEKEYVAIMNLHKDVPEDKLIDIFDYFRGEIFQRPPLRSSVKRRLRIKRINYINFMEKEDRDVLFLVNCESGTYVRKLCHDIGLILGVGAHMVELRRTRAGPFDEKDSKTLHDIKDAYEFYIEDDDEKYLRECILPIEFGVKHLKKIWIKDTAVSAICHGADLNAPGICKFSDNININELVAIMSLKNELVAIGTSLRTSKEIEEMDKGKVIDLERVIMKPDVYPRRWGCSKS